MKSAFVVMASALLSLAACGGVDQADGENNEDTATAASALCRDGKYLRHTLATGAKLHGSNGIRVGADGNLYIASLFERAIVVVNPLTGQRLRTLGNDAGVETPDDLAFGPDGSIYWTSFLTGEVGRITPSGEKRTVAQLGPGVNGIAFSESGRLFVTRVFLGDELYELDREGVGAPRLVASGLGGANSMQFGSDGQLYAPLWFLGQVARINPDTGAVQVVASGLGTPASVKFDSQGRLFVLDTLRGQLSRVDIASGALTLEADGLNGSDSFAIDSLGRKYVTNSNDGSVLQVLPLRAKRVVLEGGIELPGGIAVLRKGGKDTVYVADALSIKQLDSRSGKLTREFDTTVAVTPLQSLFSISADGDKLVTTSWFTNMVQVFDPETATVTESHADFAVPLDALRFKGELVVTELGTGSVVKKSAAGAKSTIASGMYVPTGLAATADDLYVTDWATGLVLEIVKDGAPVSPPRIVTYGLLQPEGIAVDQDGSLLVVETGRQQLVRVEPSSGATSVVEDHLKAALPGIPHFPPTHTLNGVTVGQDGTIYVTQDSTNEVLALRKRGRR